MLLKYKKIKYLCFSLSICIILSSQGKLALAKGAVYTDALIAKAAKSATYAKSEILTEQDLLRLAKASPTPQWQEITADLKSAQFTHQSSLASYSFQLNSQLNYAEERKEPIFSAQPVFSPTRQFTLSINKKLPKGILLSSGIQTEQVSTRDVLLKDATTTGIFVSAELDLWKDFWGRYSDNILKNTEAAVEFAKLNTSIRQKNYLIQVRKIYWRLIANQKAKKISKELLRTAEKQLTDSKHRLRSRVADTAEVALYESQVTSRKAHILYLGFEEESLLQQLRTMLPVLNNIAVTLSEINTATEVDSVLKCVDTIVQNKQVPLHYTKYDEMQAVLQKQRSYLRIANETYSDVDLKLKTTINTTGVSNSYSDSISDFTNNNRSGFSIGLALSIPLSRPLRNAEKHITETDELRFQAQLDRLNAAIQSNHTEIKKNVSYLVQTVEAQKDSSQALRKRLAATKQKFDQARITVSDLVNDQNTLLNSELSIIDTQLAIVNTLLDYLSIFTETPCAFNRS